MEEARQKIQYDKSLALAIQEFFCTYIVPANFLAIIHKHAPLVLADDDIARLRKKIQNSTLIEKEISQELLELMVKYGGWFQCILDVLEDPLMKQKNLVPIFKTMKSDHDRKYYNGTKGAAERPVLASQAPQTAPKQLAGDSVNNTPVTKDKRKPKVKQSQSFDGSSSSLPPQAETNGSLQTDSACGPTADAKSKKKPRGKQSQSADCSSSSSLPPQDEIKAPLQADSADAKSKKNPRVKQSQSVDGSSSSSLPPQDKTKGSLQADSACGPTADAKSTKKQGKPKPLSATQVKPNIPSAHQNPPQATNELPKNMGIPLKSGPAKKTEPVQGQPGKANSDPNPKSDMDSSFCSLCQAKFTSAVNAEEHYSGQKHKKNLESFEKSNKMFATPQNGTSVAANPPALPDLTNKPVFYLDENGQGHCNLCNVKFASSSIADAHLQGSKHKVNMALYNTKK